MTAERNVTSAETIGDQAAEWVLKQEAKTWTAQDQVELSVWLSQSDRHPAAYWRLKAGWSRAQRLAALAPMRPECAAKTKSTRRFLHLAAVASIAALAIGAIAYNSLSQTRQFATAMGQRASLMLSDGTQIELNTNSAIVAKITPWHRIVELEHGEAFFNVHHDAARPFAVLADGHRITDLGTQFSVRESADGLKVTLVEGRARLETVDPALQHHVTDLVPGDVAAVTANAMSVRKIPANALSDRLAWRSGKLVFDHATLAEAAAEFNRYNATKIVIAPEIANLQINGTFGAGSVGPFTRTVQFAFSLSAELRDHQIVIFRKKS